MKTLPGTTAVLIATSTPAIATPKNLDEPHEIAFLIIGIMIIIIVFIAQWAQTQQAARPMTRASTSVYPENLDQVTKLSSGRKYHLVVYRQSGNLHSSYEDVTLDQALRQIVTTCRRAKIDVLAVQKNTVEEMELWRVWHNHRGRQEGKRVGGFAIFPA